MTATGVLLILIGLFVVVNTTNFVGVLQGNKQINSGVGKDAATPNGGEFSGGSSGTTTGIPAGDKTTSGGAGGGF